MWYINTTKLQMNFFFLKGDELFFVSERRQIMSLQIMGWALITMFISGPSKSCLGPFIHTQSLGLYTINLIERDYGPAHLFYGIRFGPS
jgi:hypothetical protein